MRLLDKTIGRYAPRMKELPGEIRGLFETIFGNRPRPKDDEYQGFFRQLNGYIPRFTTWEGEIYESEQVRAAINALATHISKLDVEIQGTARPALRNKMKHAPNAFQTWPVFLERAATIYYATNNLIITPVYDEYGEPSGIYTPVPSRCDVLQYDGIPYLHYTFSDHKTAAIELEYCAILPRMQYKNDFFGESNRPLDDTMDLIGIQKQGIKEGVKNSASYRFMAQAGNFSKTSDLKKERKRFSQANLAKDAEGGGILLFPNTYNNIQQIKSTPFVVDSDQMKLIQDNVNKYFGVNDDILTNHFNAETWAAFYEGAVESFAIKLSDGLTKMLFTLREQSNENRVTVTANRLQYMSNQDKLAVSSQMADRGLMTRNEIRKIWNLAPLPEPYGSQLPARGEYYNINGEENKEGTDAEQ